LGLAFRLVSGCARPVLRVKNGPTFPSPMLFNSLIFALYLPIVFTLYWGLGRTRPRLQNAFIIVASYVFYGWWDVRFLGLIVLSSLVDFLIGDRLYKAQTIRRKRLLLWVSLGVNLGVLGVFKYLGFFVESARAALLSVGIEMPAMSLEIVLPVGISFYTFQTLSYTIDIYRGRLKPVSDPITFFAFVSFFPQLVAGPIERASALLPQFVKPRSFDVDRAKDGLRQMLWGFVKKVVIADNIAPAVEVAFSQHAQLDGVALICGAALFSIQLYCDFSGYSDMAIGMARLFGIELSQNFAFPYFARSMREFWRRWHISLSTWFRDYVYIPLGGARANVRRAAMNVLIVFTVSGLWHGAAWTFVIWGLLNGLYTLPALLRSTPVQKGVVAQGRLLPGVMDCVAMARTFALWTLSLVLFRATSIEQAGGYFYAALSNPYLPTVDHQAFVLPICMGFALIACEWFQRSKPHGLEIGHWPRWIRWGTYISLGLILLSFGSVKSRAFVYFQF